MFEKKPLLVKDLPFNTIKEILGCYRSLDENTEVVEIIETIAKKLSSSYDESDSVAIDKQKFQEALSDKYIKLERNLRNDLAEEEINMIKSFNLKEEKQEEKIHQLKTQIVNLTQDLGLIKKENAILEQKIDDQDELIAEISKLEALVSALTAENNEKDAKFNLLKEIYDNPRIQDVKIINPTVIEPTVLEPRMIPTVSCNQKQHGN